MRFREIDAAYPGTNFLLNVHDKADWLQSRLYHRRYAQRFIAVHDLSGIDTCLAMWFADWDRHLADVRSYIADRPDDLVSFNIDKDSIDDLIAQLSDFALNRCAWNHIGKSNPEHVAHNRAALDAFVIARPDRSEV
ncbi:MAG: hypothetical protein ACJASZ_000975 [Yoonia sp.]